MYFLNINKPKGLTSFDVIRQLRKRLNIKQIGHSGTLDPLACGVLQIGVGECTKLLDYLGSNKEYIANIKFGYTTTTYDSEGDKEFIKKPEFSSLKLKSALENFSGKIIQTPPKYSAIKINGKKACDIVRKNINKDIEIPQREITIYSIELINFNGFDEAQIKVQCSKGTYIRTLAHDIGKYLCCGAYLSDLKRTKAGNFYIENSNSLNDENLSKINPLDVINFDKKELNEFEYKRILNGNFIKTEGNFKTNTILLTKNNKLVSIANLSDNILKPKKLFRSNCL